jgi:hypothetical protein
MKANEGDGLPEIGERGRYLGVRPGVDVLVGADGFVEPYQPGAKPQGLSVSPPPASNLPRHRRPLEFGGTGSDPIFELETEDLPEGLAYRPDPDDPGHGLIGPARRMGLEEYRAAILETRVLWRRVRPEDVR